MSESANTESIIHEVSIRDRLAYDLFGKCLQSLHGSYDYSNVKALQDVVDFEKSGSLVLLWHNRLLPAIGAFHRVNDKSSQVYALVSASRDGAKISHFLASQGIRTVRGSSSRRSVPATRELFRILADGNHVVITMDGPRGPCYKAQPGASLLVQRTEVPVYFMGLECENAWEMNSWDRFLVPKPFSRVKIKLDRCASFAREKGKEQRQAIQEEIQSKLSSLTMDSHRGS